MNKLRVAFLAGFMDGFSTEGLKKFEAYQKELKKKVIFIRLFHFFQKITLEDLYIYCPFHIRYSIYKDEKNLF